MLVRKREAWCFLTYARSATHHNSSVAHLADQNSRWPHLQGQDVPMTLPRPESADRGRISSEPDAVIAETVAAWDAFLLALADVDRDGPTRTSNRSVARVLTVLGSWPEGRPLEHLRADAIAGRHGAEALDDTEGRVLAMRAHATDDQILAALRRARDDIAAWGASTERAAESLLDVGGPLGVVPLGTLVAASSYQLAVASRDLAPAGMHTPDIVLDAGVCSLLDSVGAVVAASGSATERAPLDLSVDMPRLSVRICVVGADWRVDVGERSDTVTDGGPSLTCTPDVLVDIASGRLAAPVAYARGAIQAHDLVGVLRVATILASAPGLPGTEGLRAAVGAYAATTRAADAMGRAVGGAWRRLRRE